MKSRMLIDKITGAKYWFNELNQYHREDGPARIFTTGEKEWWINGKLHREDGPAVITLDVHCRFRSRWYYNGMHVPFPAWCEMTNKTEEEIVLLKMKYNADINEIWTMGR